MTNLEQVLDRFGYKLVSITRFKNVDRIHVSKPQGHFALTVTLRGHVENFTLDQVLEGLLTDNELRAWRKNQ